MAAEIYIVSGFLGAGKTTLIQKILKEAFRGEKVVLLENDFGEISVDAALLRAGGVEVKEISAGCICCSLFGDFITALEELLARFQPDKIIIEPSGVSKLSDIIAACSAPRIAPYAQVKGKITVVDGENLLMYRDSFGDFFADQIRGADMIFLNRLPGSPDQIREVEELIKELNAGGKILAQPWAQINMAELLVRQDGEPPSMTCRCGHEHKDHSHSHGEDCPPLDECEHTNRAEEVFDSVTIRTKRVFSAEDLKERMGKMAQEAQGTILRVKGIVRGRDGYLNLQYLPGDVQITQCAVPGDMLCIIGRNLNRRELGVLFGGE